MTVWQDTKPVVVLSTQHSPTDTTTVERKKNDGSTITVSCPQAIADYNRHIGGVDLGDQYRGYYAVRTKSRKFYRYIFWFLVEVCILNSYIYHRYSASTKKIKTYLEYRIALAEQLIGDYNTRKRPGRTPSANVPAAKRMTISHFPGKTK